MITEQELEDLKSFFFLKFYFNVFNHLVHIQCTKPPDVMTRTAELLDGVNEKYYANKLRGQ